MDLLHLRLQQAFALHKQGKLSAAEKIYSDILKSDPRQFDALHLLGVLALQTGRPQIAVSMIGKAVAVDRKSPQALNNLGEALREMKRYAEALDAYDRAIGLAPAYAEAHNNRGNALAALNRHAEALAGFERAIVLNPAYGKAHNNRGITLMALGRAEEAEASYRRALEVLPDLAEAHNNRGLALQSLNRIGEAEASFRKAVALRPNFAAAHNNVGVLLAEQNRLNEAVACYDAAIACDPGYADAYLNRGNGLSRMRRFGEAVQTYDRAAALAPERADVLVNRGDALASLGKLGDAIESLKGAFRINPAYDFLLGTLLHTRRQACDWTGFEADLDALEKGLHRRNKVITPFAALSVVEAPGLQRVASEIWADNIRSGAPLPAPPMVHKGHEKPRIGYFSADFRDHAVMYLASELFENHDRDRFETVAFSFGPGRGEPMRERAEQAFGIFHDVQSRSDHEVAALARDMEIDIAVDLMGYTDKSRPGIFLNRPAPVQVNYLGFPGTSGAAFMDYIIADRIVVPDGHADAYSEKIVRLPDSFQISSARTMSNQPVNRADCGLPDDAFVFCCFNNSHKITPQVFDCWMRMLGAVPGAVLWLVGDRPAIKDNLLREASARGVDPARLVFADRAPPEVYLSRFAVADLFLDTLPFNAGTTASDSLWSGLPLLTRFGECFAGRMAASILTAFGLPELIAHSEAEYERIAVDLALSPERMAVLKDKVRRNRRTSPLFDTKAFTRHLEAAYAAMHDRARQGLPPDHIDISRTNGAQR